MSYIHWNKLSRTEFINHIINGNNCNFKIEFIKKYESILYFLPIVINNLIMTYVNDVITFDCRIFLDVLRMYSNAIVNYKQMNLIVYIPLTPKSHCHNTICMYNQYMKYHYNYGQYINTTCNNACYTYNFTMMPNKGRKYEAIILRKIYNVLKKIDITYII